MSPRLLTRVLSALALLAPAAALAAPPEITTLELPGAVERQAYEATLIAEGEGTLRFEVVGGSLPWGLTLDADGRIHGQPSFASTFSFDVRVRGPGGQDVETLSLAVAPWQRVDALACGGSATVTLTAAARSPTAVLDLDRPGAAAFFYVPITAQTAAVDLRVEASSGDPILLLPRASWAPGSPQVYAYTLIEDHPGDEALRLTDGTPHYGLYNYGEVLYVPVTVAADAPGTFEVRAACTDGVALGPAWLPNARLGEPYGAALVGWRGVAPLSFSAEGLPVGLEVDEVTGWISGTPVEAGLFTARVEVVAADGASDVQDLDLWVAVPEPVTCGQTVAGSLTARAFDGARGLATPGGVDHLLLELGAEVTRIEVEARLTDGDGSLGLWQSQPGAPGGSSIFGEWLRHRWGGPARLTIDTEDAPTVAGFGGRVELAVAAVGAPGAYELQIVCDDAPVLTPRFLPPPDVGAPYAAQLTARGAGVDDATFAVVAGALPEGLSLSPSGAITGEAQASGPFAFTVAATLPGGETAARAYSGAVGEGGCGPAGPLACGDFLYSTLSASAWQDRVSLDLSVAGATEAWCLDPGEASEVTLSLTPVSGSDPDLLVGAPGVPPGVDTVSAYEAVSARSDVDEVTLVVGGYPDLSQYGGAPVAVTVAAHTPGGYTLEVACQ